MGCTRRIWNLYSLGWTGKREPEEMLRKRGLKRDKIKVKYVVTFVFESTLSECSTIELCPQQDVLLNSQQKVQCAQDAAFWMCAERVLKPLITTLWGQMKADLWDCKQSLGYAMEWDPEAGEISLEHLLLWRRAWVRFSALTWGPTTICNSSVHTCVHICACTLFQN